VSLACFDAVFEFAVAAAADGDKETLVDLCEGADPFGVGEGETGGGVDEGPHDEGAGNGEDGGVGKGGDYLFDLVLLILYSLQNTQVGFSRPFEHTHL
jgi:hypothetical protein